MLLLNNANTLEWLIRNSSLCTPQTNIKDADVVKTLVRSGGGRGLGSAVSSSESGKKGKGIEREVKYERNSLLPNNVPRTSPSSMPKNELRSEIHGLHWQLFLWGLWTSFQKAESYRQAAKANSMYLD